MASLVTTTVAGTLTATSTTQPVVKAAYNANHYLGIGHHYIDLNYTTYTNDLELRTGGTPRLTINRSTGAATFSGDVTVSNNSTDVDWSNNSNPVSTGGGGIMVSNQQSLDNTFSSIMWVAKETAGTDQNFAIINQSTAATTYTPKVYFAQRTDGNEFTAALTIDESQNVGIGTTNPGNYKLYVDGDVNVSSGQVNLALGQNFQWGGGNCWLTNDANYDLLLATYSSTVSQRPGLRIAGNNGAITAYRALTGTSATFANNLTCESTFFTSEYIKHLGDDDNWIRFTTNAIEFSKPATFSGGLTATTGTFSGALTGTTATFTGEVDLNVGLDWHDPTSSVYGRLGYGSGFVYVGALGATGILKLFAGGAAAVHILADGKVGIGTTNPGAYKLYVNGTTYVNGQMTAALGHFQNSSHTIVTIKAHTSGDKYSMLQMTSNGTQDNYIRADVGDLVIDGSHTSVNITKALDVTGALTGTTATFSGLTTLSGGARLMLGQALLGQTSGGTSTQLIYWGGTDIYYGRSATSPNNATVASHIFRAAGNTRLTVDNSNITLAAALSGTSATFTKSSGLAHLALVSNPANQVADIGGEIIFQATYRATSDTAPVARIKGSRENATTNNWKGKLTFHTSPGGDSPSASTERMRINGDGKVGIGITNPGHLLDVNGTGYFSGNVSMTSTSPTLNIAGAAVNQVESGRIRLTEAKMTGSPYFQGAFIHYDGSANKLNIGVHPDSNSTAGDDINAIQIDRAAGAVTFGAAGGTFFTQNISFTSTAKYITFYGNDNAHHGIGSRDGGGSEADDLRINTYGALYINLDSNGNNSSTADFHIAKHGGTGAISASDYLLMLSGETGKLQLKKYGSGTHTGTSAYKLSVDSSGNVIETAVGAGAVDGSGTTNYISKWTDGDTIGDSVVYETAAGTIGIHAGTNVEGMVDVQMKMNGVDWTYGNWGEVWCAGGAAGSKFNDCVFHLDTDRGGGGTGGIVGLAFSPGWQGHQNWGIYSTNEYGGSYTQGDLRFVNQLNTPAGSYNERVTFKADGKVGIGTTTPSEKLEVTGAIKVNQDANNYALYIDSEATGYESISVRAKWGMYISQDIGGGYGMHITRNLNEGGSYPLVTINSDHTANTQPALHVNQDGAGYGIHITQTAANTALNIAQSGGGRGVSIDQDTNNYALYIDSEATGYESISIRAKYGMYISQDIGGGYGMYIQRNLNEAGSSPLANFIDDHTAGTQTTVYIRHDGSSGYGLDCVGTGRFSGALTIGAYTLPTADGTTGYHLQTDGAGAVTWQPGGAGTVTGSGLDNFVPQWNGTTALEDSIIYSHAYGVIINATNTSSYATNRQVFEVFGTAGTGAFDGGIANLTAATNTNAQKVGQLVFVNSANANHVNPNAAAGSRIAQIISTLVTTDSNAGDDSGGDLQFWTKPEAGLPAERMRIQSDGNVGIGITNPYNALHLYSTTGNASGVLVDGSATNSGYLSFRQAGVEKAYIQYTSNSYIRYSTPSGVHSFGQAVGIGTIGPACLLHVERRTYSSTSRILILTNSTATPYGGAGYDTLVINQDDVPCIRLRETAGANPELTFAVGNENSQSAVIGTTGMLRFCTNRNAGTTGYSSTNTRMVIDEANGYVGLGGRTAPSTTLVIQGIFDGSATPSVSAPSNNTANKGIEIIREANDNSWGVGYTYGIDFAATSSVNSTNQYKVAAIYGAVESVPYYVAGKLGFYTTTGVNNALLEERMTIKGDGNVGIGTTGPESILNLYSQAASGDTTLRIDHGNSLRGDFYLRSDNYSSTLNRFIIGEVTGGDFFTIMSDNDGSGGGAGFVGIKNAAPTCILDMRDGGDANTKMMLINTQQTTAGRETEFIFGKDNGANLSATLKYYYHTTQASRRIDLLHYLTNAGLTILNNGKIGLNTTAPDTMLTLKGGTVNGATQYPSIHGKHGSQTLYRLEQYYGNEGYLGLFHNGAKTIQFRGGENSGGAAHSYINAGSGNNFGVGTTAPATKLTIESDSTGESISDGLRLQNSHGVNNDISPIYFGVHGGTRRAKCGIGWKRTGSYGIGKLLFALDNNGDDADVSFANDTKITFQGDGKVGIGTTAPSTSLHVHKATGGTDIKLSAGNYGTNYGFLGIDSITLGLATGNGVRAISISHSNQYVAIGGQLWYPKANLHVRGKTILDNATTAIGSAVPTTLYVNDQADATIGFGIRAAGSNAQAIIGLDDSDGDKFKISYTTTDIGAVSHFTLQSDGNVGIGNTSPDFDLEVGNAGGTLNAGFRIVGEKGISAATSGISTYLWADGTTHGLNAWNYAGGAHPDLYIGWAGKNVLLNAMGAGGKVGIGSATPIRQLDVLGAVAGQYSAALINTSATGHGLYIKAAPNSASYMALAVDDKDGATILVARGDKKVGIGTNAPSSELHVNGGLTSGTNDDNRALFGYTSPRFYIGTRQSGTNYLDTVSVTSGKVGIGTTNPTARLYVVETANNAWALQVKGTGTSANYGLEVNCSAGYNLSSQPFKVDTPSGGPFFIDGNANVGIGDGTPTYKLDVNGTGRFTGALTGTSATFSAAAVVRQGVYIGSFTTASALQFEAPQNGTSQIKFYDNNATEGCYIKSVGHTYGGKISLGARWNSDQDRVVFDMAKGGSYDVKVGIGTAAPGGKLDVYSSATRYVRVHESGSLGDLQVVSDNGTMPAFAVKGTGTADLVNVWDGSTEVFTILDGGKVGIGTTAPAHKLSLLDGAVGGFINPRSATSLVAMGSNTNHALQIYSGGDERIRVKTDGKVGINSTNPSTILSLGGSLATGGIYINSGADEDHTIIDMTGITGGGKLIWDDGEEAFSMSKGLRVTAGKVGIGTNVPNHRLTVRESGEAISGSNVDISNLALQIIKPLDTDGGAVGFGLGSSTTETNIGGAMIFERLGSNSYGKLHFATKGVTTASADIPIRMTIDNAGSVGIGTTNPSQLLDVNGTTRLRGALYDKNNSYGTSGQVLSTTGSGGVDWVDASGGGGGDTVSITTSADDILSVSSGAISGVDAGSSDKIVFWDNTQNKLTYLAASTGLYTSGTNLKVTSAVLMSIQDTNYNYCTPSSNTAGFYQGGSITVVASGNGVTFSDSTSSDYRLKSNISTFNSEAWTKVKSVNLRKFDFDESLLNPELSTITDKVGFIAHELAEAGIEGAVEGTKDEVDSDGNPVYQKVCHAKLVPVMWGALREAITKIETLETKVQTLENS